MKLSILIDSVLIVTSIALLPGIGGTQMATKNSGEPIAINSDNLSNHSIFIANWYKVISTSNQIFQ